MCRAGASSESSLGSPTQTGTMKQLLAHPPSNLNYHAADQVKWQRIALLSILIYEGLGAIAGGLLLVVAPDGRYMEMPVELMHGVFNNFLVPGLILFALGMLNLLAFFTVLRKRTSDWLMAGLALGGLFIWFVVEIIILQELHWLHGMWGIPVLMGWVVLMPLIALRHDTTRMQRLFLTCGVLSSLWYLFINVIVTMQDPAYSAVTQTISELSAIDAPTRILWVLLSTLYPLLYAAFGWGVLQSAAGNRYLRIAGILIIIHSAFNFFWPPMHLREVLAAGGGTLTDDLHITWAIITLLFNILIMGFGAAALGKRFRVFTIACYVLFVVFGTLVWMESPGISKNLPTPGIGIWERINIAVNMGWIAVMAVLLIRKRKLHSPEPDL
jgi:hypothetical protein